MYDSIRLHRYLGYSFRPWRALGLFLPGAWFSSWYVISIDTGHIAQSPHFSPRWSPAFKIEPVLFRTSCSHTLLVRWGGDKSVQFSHSVVPDFATPWTEAHQASLSITNSQSLLKLTSTESVMPPNHVILCRPLLLLLSIFPLHVPIHYLVLI